jgi:protein deglycase
MKTVLLFLAKGFEELEAAAFIDVMGWSRVHGNEPVNLVTFGLQPSIKANWNLTVIPELTIEQVNEANFDALAIPGGFENNGYYEDAFDSKIVKLIQDFHQNQKPIASICVGALTIANSGVLKNKDAITYDLEGGRIEQLEKMGATIKKQPIVVSDHIITSTGPSTATDVAFKLLEMLTNKQNVTEVKKYMRF